MSLTTTMIKKRLASVASNLKDNEAQNIINGASTSDIKSDPNGFFYTILKITSPPPLFILVEDI